MLPWVAAMVSCLPALAEVTTASRLLTSWLRLLRLRPPETVTAVMAAWAALSEALLRCIQLPTMLSL